MPGYQQPFAHQDTYGQQNGVMMGNMGSKGTAYEPFRHENV